VTTSESQQTDIIRTSQFEKFAANSNRPTLSVPSPTLAPEIRTVPSEPEYYYEYENEEDYSTIQEISKLPKTTTEIYEEVITTTKAPIIQDITEEYIDDSSIESELDEKVPPPSLDILRIPGETLDKAKEETPSTPSFNFGFAVNDAPAIDEYIEDYSTVEEYEEEYDEDITDYDTQDVYDTTNDYEAQNDYDTQSDYENQNDYDTEIAVERISVQHQPQVFEAQGVRSNPQWPHNQQQRITPTTNKWQRMHLRRQSQNYIPESREALPIKLKIPVKMKVPVSKVASAPKPKYPPRSRDPLMKLIQSSSHRNWGSRRKAQPQTYYEVTPRKIPRTEEMPQPQPQAQERTSSSEYREISRILQQFDFESKRS